MMAFLATPAIFLALILLGFALKARGVFGQDDYKVVVRIVMFLTMPATIIHSFGSYSNGSTAFAIMALGAIFTFGPMAAVWAATPRLEKYRRAFYMVNCCGFNVGSFALPLIYFYFGAPGMLTALMFDVGNACIMTGGSYAITSHVLRTDGREPFSRLFVKLFKAVPFDAYVVCLAVSLLGIRIPQWLVAATEPFADANAFVAMFMMGLMMRPSEGRLHYLKATAATIGVRLFFGSLLAAAAWWVLPLPLQARMVLCIIAFSPLGTLAPAYTEKCRADGRLASFTNTVQLFVSLGAITVLLTVFHLANTGLMH